MMEGADSDAGVPGEFADLVALVHSVVLSTMARVHPAP